MTEQKEADMLNWFPDLYITDAAYRDSDKVIEKLNQGKFVPSRYLVTLASNPADQLDLVSTVWLKQEQCARHLPPVIGIAASRADAVDLVIRITEECLAETGSTDLRSYIESRR